jgi:hypothetical protein
MNCKENAHLAAEIRERRSNVEKEYLEGVFERIELEKRPRVEKSIRKAISKESVQEQSAVDKVEAEIAMEKECRKHLLQDVADMRIRRYGLEDRLSKVIFVFFETIWQGLMNLNAGSSGSYYDGERCFQGR